MPAITMEMLAATSSYSAKLAKPCFLAMLSSSAWTLGSGLSDVALHLLGDRGHVLLGGDEALDLLVGELDLLDRALRRRDAAEVRQRDGGKRRDHQSEHLLHGVILALRSCDAWAER